MDIVPDPCKQKGASLERRAAFLPSAQPHKPAAPVGAKKTEETREKRQRKWVDMSRPISYIMLTKKRGNPVRGLDSPGTQKQERRTAKLLCSYCPAGTLGKRFYRLSADLLEFSLASS